MPPSDSGTIDARDARIVRNAYVDLPQGQVHVRAAAGEAPPIVFLHQTASSAGSYLPLMKTLRLSNRLIAIDTPGFGGSFDPPDTPTLDDYAAILLATLDGLGVDQAHLFGHHTGANLALAIGAIAPERILSLMLAGPVFLTETERADFLRDYREPIRPVCDGAHLRTNWDYAARFNPACDLDVLHDEVVSMLRAWRGRAQAYAAVAHQDGAAVAGRIDQPVLLLTSPDDFFHATFGRATTLFPDAPTATTGGGNFQPTVDPEGVSAAIVDFLRLGA